MTFQHLGTLNAVSVGMALYGKTTFEFTGEKEGTESAFQLARCDNLRFITLGANALETYPSR